MPPRIVPPVQLRAAGDIAAFVNDPVDRYVVGRCFCFWQIGTKTKGVIAWGAPDASDASEMVQAFEAGARLDQPHVSLVDMRALRAVDIAAFEVVMTYMTRRQEVFEKTVLRQALLHGGDAVGAAVAGFYAVVPARYPVAVFRDLGEALRWLQPDDTTRTAAVVDQLRGSFAESPEIVSKVRSVFATYATVPTLSGTSRLLGMSPRSLQRSLEASGTSFRLELMRERLERAERMLLGTTLSVKAVATAVNLSAGRLTALFMRAHGVGPTTWRTRRADACAASPAISFAERSSRSTRPGRRDR